MISRALSTVLLAERPTPLLTSWPMLSKEEFGALQDIVVQLAELRGEGAWKQMRYDLEVACVELRGAETKLVEVSRHPRNMPLPGPGTVFGMCLPAMTAAPPARGYRGVTR